MHPASFGAQSPLHEWSPESQYEDHDPLEGYFSPDQQRDSDSGCSFTDGDDQDMVNEFHEVNVLCVAYVPG